MRSPAAILALLALAGCTPNNTARTFDVAPGSYARSFDSAVEALRELHFAIDRVDAQAGVITASPKQSSGLATPWDLDQSTLTQEVEDLLADHRRRVRITFEPGQGAGPDAPLEGAPVLGRVEAVIDRRYLRHWRASSASILASDLALDPQELSRGEAPEYDVPLTRDERLAARIADRIRKKLER